MILRLLWIKATNMQSEAVWIIDEDIDDRELIQEAWIELNLPNQLCFLSNAEEVLQQLGNVEVAPFMIICEVNLSQTDGFALREAMLRYESPKYHSVPFIFWSTMASEAQIQRAFDLSVHGFFIKDSSFEELKRSFMLIINYWMKSKMPAKQYSV
jgi:DNA-binding NarL/FixJ family response regulator